MQLSHSHWVRCLGVIVAHKTHRPGHFSLWVDRGNIGRLSSHYQQSGEAASQEREPSPWVGWEPSFSPVTVYEWFSTFLMLQPLILVPHFLETPTIKVILLAHTFKHSFGEGGPGISEFKAGATQRNPVFKTKI